MDKTLKDRITLIMIWYGGSTWGGWRWVGNRMEATLDLRVLAIPNPFHITFHITFRNDGSVSTVATNYSPNLGTWTSSRWTEWLKEQLRNRWPNYG